MLADITVGYMGGEGEQWLLVRNARGEELLGAARRRGARRDARQRRQARTAPVKGFLANTERAAGGLPLRRMPNWLRPIVGWLMPRIGPRGLEFARARVEMKAVETVLHLRRQQPRHDANMVPAHVWALVEALRTRPLRDERPAPVKTKEAHERALARHVAAPAASAGGGGADPRLALEFARGERRRHRHAE